MLPVRDLKTDQTEDLWLDIKPLMAEEQARPAAAPLSPEPLPGLRLSAHTSNHVPHSLPE